VEATSSIKKRSWKIGVHHPNGIVLIERLRTERELKAYYLSMKDYQY